MSVSEARARADAVITASYTGTARNRCDHSGRRDLPNRVVASIGYIDIVICVYGHADRAGELRLRAGPISAANAAAAGEHCHIPGGIHLLNLIVPVISHI